MQVFAALIAGVLFGIGLIISGMANPAKVQNFLDVFGRWDPSLAFVMAGAIVATTVGFAALRKWDRPLFSQKFSWPTATVIDARLIGGAALFGIGWGLAGFCPGPALTSLLLAAKGTLMFVPAMLVGMWLARRWTF